MLTFNLSAILGAKRIKLSKVVIDTGINRSTLTRLYHETTTRVDFDTLETLSCYLQCEPGDLFTLSDTASNPQSRVDET